MSWAEQVPLPPGAQHARFAVGERLEELENAARVQPIVRFSEGCSSTSVTWVSIDGRHRRLSSSRSARCYYVLSGELAFVLGSSPPVHVQAGDALVVPRGCAYGFEGSATYLVMNTPAFEPGDDDYAEAPSRP
jgi:mannose-6-phosphate isomerase-like protein (cupin superfamily)